MNKPEHLRAHLLATVAELKHNPDRLLIFIDNGKIRCTAAASLSFEYSFDLQIILTDFAGHPDSVMLPLLGWLSVNQSELLENLDKVKNGIQFEADILDKDKVDLSVTLPLTERVIVGQDEQGNTTVKHAGEPLRVAGYLDPNWRPGRRYCWYGWSQRRATNWPAASGKNCAAASKNESLPSKTPMAASTPLANSGFCAVSRGVFGENWRCLRSCALPAF